MKDFVGKQVRQKRPRGKNGECRDTAKVTIVKHGIRRVYSLGRWGSPEAERAYNQLVSQYYADTLDFYSDKKVIADYFRTYSLTADVEAMSGPLRCFTKKVITWFIELFGSAPCSALSINMITAFKDKVLYEAQKNNWSNYYANRLLQVMKQILITGVIKGWFDSSLLPIIKSYPKIRNKLKPPHSRSVVEDAVVEKTLKYLQQPYVDMIRLIRSACLRPSELLRMRKSDI